MVVDDDDDILKTLTTLLSTHSYGSETARTGKEATQKSRTKIFNIALLDIVLPDMQGTDLLVKMEDTTPKMYKIIITGHATQNNAVKVLNLGADAYIMKPIDPENLLKVIKEQMRKRREDVTITQRKIKKYIETRAKEIDYPSG